MTIFGFVRKNMFRKKLRAILMLAATFIAFLIFGVLMAFFNAFNSGTENAAADRMVVVNKINFTQTMPYAYFNRVKAVEGVELVGHANWFGGYYQDPKNQIPVFAVNPEEYLDLYPEWIVEDDVRDAFLNDRTAMLIGSDLALRLGIEAGTQIPMFSNIYSHKDGGNSWTFNVVGLIEGKDKDTPTANVIMHYDYFNETITFGQDNIGWMVVRTASPDLNDAVAERIDTQFANSQAETKTSSEKAFNKAFIAQLGNITLIVGLVVGAAFLTILMIVGNTMVMSIRERTKEIGVLKTLGFSSQRILRMVLAESLMLSFIGGLLGMGAAALVVAVMSVLLQGFIPGMAVGGDVFLQALGVMFVLGLITGLPPALSAMRLPIIKALSRG